MKSATTPTDGISRWSASIRTVATLNISVEQIKICDDDDDDDNNNNRTPNSLTHLTFLTFRSLSW